jgi:energy-coupling factor transporter transmembrane protein EcfT
LPEFFIPQEDAALIYLRAGLFAAFSIASLLVVLYGLYGWYVRSMSGGNPDKVSESMSIYKNAIIGVVIIFSSLIIIQIVYVLIGITQSPFDFNFIPKIGRSVSVTEGDVGRKCYSSQKDSNNRYECVDGVWK